MVKTIEMTPKAGERLRSQSPGEDYLLTLKYDIDGCGCAVSGMPALAWVKKQEIDPDDVKIETGELPVYMNKERMIFFDPDMKIDYLEEKQTYKLSSPNQILNGRMSCAVSK